MVYDVVECGGYVGGWATPRPAARCGKSVHYAPQIRCSLGPVIYGHTVQLKISALCHNRHVFCAVSFAQSIGDVLTTLTLCNLWSRHREFGERKKELYQEQEANPPSAQWNQI